MAIQITTGDNNYEVLDTGIVITFKDEPIKFQLAPDMKIIMSFILDKELKEQKMNYNFLGNHKLLLTQDLILLFLIFDKKYNKTQKIEKEIFYTNAKSLFIDTLRIVSFIKTAIILEYDAFKASKEALKEEGKLIVILTAKDICEVNKLKDKGYEPSIILKVKIDEMLIKLKR